MDPALLQGPSRTSIDDVKPSTSYLAVDHHPPEFDYDSHDHDSEDDSHPADGDASKRPRLRLAHACDRCRKRKIRCDTQQPCGPCSATRNQCTFQTPSRRIVKPKQSGDGKGAEKTTSGVKRPHSVIGPGAGTSGQSQATLEARLATLEAMLRDVPPNVHNAYLSKLDASLGGGTGVGIKEGGGEGVGIAVEALTGAGVPDYGTGSVGWMRPPALNPMISGSWQGNAVGSGSRGNAWTNRLGAKRREEEGVDAMAQRMEGLSFFYEDEIGQAKWQGKP
jgi:hypothetical protein